MTIKPLSSLGVTGLPPGSRLKVCIVSLIGAVGNGGIGTATDAIARHIASDGHEVTLLYSLVEYGVPINVARPGETAGNLRSLKDWSDDLAAVGVRLEVLDHQGSHNAWLEKSWRVKEYIGSQLFDVVCFDEWQGTGYYSLLAKRAGLPLFERQLHVVLTHASKQWVCMSNDEYLRQVSDVMVLGMERRSVEMADVVISPSRYLLEQYDLYGWKLPPNSFHHPLPLLKEAVSTDGRLMSINEIVFFGRLEVRKGLWLFCDALDRLADQLTGKTVTFMGPVTYAFGTSSGVELLQRSTNWRFRVRIVTDYSSKEAQRYLAAGGRLAVMPSLDDNSPCVVYECMQAGIPFLTTSSGGAKELIDVSSHPDAVVEPSADALASRLATILRDGARTAAPSFSPTEALATWTGWLRLVAQSPAVFRNSSPAESYVYPTKPPLLVMIDGGHCQVSELAGNISLMTRRFGKQARLLFLSNRRGQAWTEVKDLILSIAGTNVASFGPGSHNTARETILSAEIAFFVDANTELLTPFFLMALGVLAKSRQTMVSCVGASGARGKDADPVIDHLPAGDIPGLAALGQVITGPVWAISPQRLAAQLAQLEFLDSTHCELMNAWTLGETMVRLRGGADVVLLPLVGAITQLSDAAQPIRDAGRLRSGARQLGLGTSLHTGGAPWFAVQMFGAHSDLPVGAHTLRHHGKALIKPLEERVAEAETEGDLARMAALCGRPDLALQIESGKATSAARMQQLIALSVEAVRQKTVIDLIPALAGAAAIEAGTSFEPDWMATPSTAFRDPRLFLTDGYLCSTDSTRSGGPAKLRFFDLQVAGHEVFEVQVRSHAPQPLLMRLKVIDQDSGDMIGEAATRITMNEPGEVSLQLPGIFGCLTVLLEFSGAERIKLAVATLALR